MDELVGQSAAKAGNGDAFAEETIGIILGFLRSEGPTDEVQASIDPIPGAEAAIAASTSRNSLAGLIGGGSMALDTKLMGLGLGITEIQSITRNFSSSATTKSERIRWARSSRGHRGLASSLKHRS
jgi:hypothetical protein